MTVFAFEFICFVKNVFRCSGHYLAMTADTGNILMFSVQFESSFVVIESIDLPFVKGMTCFTISAALHIKLAVVCVLMALCTVDRKSGKSVNVFFLR